MKIKFGATKRGFAIGTFKDLYGAECSIQNADPKIMASKAKEYGVNTNETTGEIIDGWGREQRCPSCEGKGRI